MAANRRLRSARWHTAWDGLQRVELFADAQRLHELASFERVHVRTIKFEPLAVLPLRLESSMPVVLV